MGKEIESFHIQKSLLEAQKFNDLLLKKESGVVELVSGLIAASCSPLMLSHAGLVLTPRIWSAEVKNTLAVIANTSRLGLKKVARYLVESDDQIASGIRHNMLGGVHFEAYERALKLEAIKGISVFPDEVGRADIINGGAIEVNAACLDAPADFHDLAVFHARLIQELIKNGSAVELSAVPEGSIVELIVDTMIKQCVKNGRGHKPILAWLGTASEIFGGRDRGGYWPRELRFKQIAEAYLNRIGFEAEIKLICVEQLKDPCLVDKIDSAYRNLLPEDMEVQSTEAIAGLCALAAGGRLVGSLTAELLTNKAAMAVIMSPELAGKAGINKKEWQFYASVFPPTAFLSSESIWWDGQEMKIDELIKHQKDKLFFKLANGEEGHGVWSGDTISEEKLNELLALIKSDPYAVLIQKKIPHLPFEAVVVNLGKFSMEHLTGETDMGTHYQLAGGDFGYQKSNIIMTRFAAKNGATVTTNAGGDGIFRPVATYIKK